MEKKFLATPVDDRCSSKFMIDRLLDTWAYQSVILPCNPWNLHQEIEIKDKEKGIIYVHMPRVPQILQGFEPTKLEKIKPRPGIIIRRSATGSAFGDVEIEIEELEVMQETNMECM